VVNDATDRKRRESAAAECAQFSSRYPAAALVRPEAPAAANYGAIFAVIGHEISHTFNTEGSAFDSKGRARD